MAQTDSNCLGNLYAPSEVSDPLAWWGRESIYTIYKRTDELGMHYTIRGDHVYLSSEQFPSLERRNGEVATNVRTLTIDAREITIAMPILIDDAEVRLFAEKVRFTFKGWISILSHPVSNNQGVTIRTHILDLKDSNQTPFRFATRNWPQNGGARTWPVAGGAKRKLSIYAYEVYGSQYHPTTIQSFRQHNGDPIRLFQLYTLDNTHILDDSDRSAYDILLGKAGADKYNEALNREMFWPEETVTKLLRLFARAPYEGVVKNFISKKLNQYRDLFAARESQTAISSLVRLQTYLNQGTDAFGLGPHQVPMTNFSQRRQNFTDYITLVFGEGDDKGLLAYWDSAWIQALQGGEIDREALKELTNNIDLNEQQQKTIKRQIANQEQAITNKNNEIGALLVEVTERQAVLKAAWEREQEELEDIDQVVSIAKTVAVASSAVFPAAAPALLALSTAISIAGESIYQHNSGKPVDAQSLIKTIAEVQEEHTRYRKTLTEMHKSWKKSETQFGAAWDHIRGAKSNKTAFKNYTSAIGEYAKGASELIKQLKPPGHVASIELQDYESNDVVLQAHLQKLEQIRTEESVLQAGYLEMTDVQHQLQASLLEKLAVRKELLSLNLTNDTEKQRHAQLSRDARRILLRDVAEKAAKIRRSYYYVTGSAPEILTPLLFFADDWAASGADIESEYYNPEELRKRLEEKHDEAKRSYQTFAAFVDRELENFGSHFGERPPESRLFSASSRLNLGNNTFDVMRREFVNEINKHIKGQISAKAGRNSRRIPIYIPFQPIPPAPAEPLILLGIVVEEITLTRDSPPLDGKEINFVIETPRRGVIYYSHGCYEVADSETELAEGDSIAPTARDPWPTSFTTLERKQWGEVLMTYHTFGNLLARAYPFYAPYYLYVEIPEPKAWDRPPVIERIDIQFVRTGPRF